MHLGRAAPAKETKTQSATPSRPRRLAARKRAAACSYRGVAPRLHRATLGPAQSSVRDSTVRCTWGAPPRPKRPKPSPRRPPGPRRLAARKRAAACSYRGVAPRLHRATLGPAQSSVRDSTVRCSWGAPPRPKRPKPIPRRPRTIRNLAPFTPFGRQKTRFIPKRRAIGSIPDRAISAAGKALKTPRKHPKPGLSALKVPKNRVIYAYRQSAPPRKNRGLQPSPASD
jgi:hypothetical protein